MAREPGKKASTDEIHGPSIVLRRISPFAFARQTLGWTRDRQAMANFGLRDRQMSLAKWWRRLRKFARKPRYCYGIWRTGSGQAVGLCALAIERDGETVNIGILIGDAGARRSGVATEAILFLADDLFERQGVHCIAAQVNADNTASLRFFKRCGFKSEGIARRQALLAGGHVGDRVLLALLRDTWKEERREIVERLHMPRSGQDGVRDASHLQTEDMRISGEQFSGSTAEWRSARAIALSTQRLDLVPLRPFRIALASHHWTRDREAFEGLELSPTGWSRLRWLRQLRRYARRGRISHEIRTAGNDRLIGLHMAVVEPPGVARIGILIGDAVDRGHGIAAEARAAVLDDLFGRLGVEVVTGSVKARNFASVFNYVRLGFVRDAILRDRVRTESGSRSDKIVFSLLREEWDTVRATLGDDAWRGEK